MKKHFALLFLLMCGITLLSSASVLAQDQSAEHPAQATSAVCVGIGALISIVVNLTKRITFIRDNPKFVAGILSALASVLGYFLDIQHGVGEILVCTFVQLASAIGAYELAIKPLSKPPQSL